MEYTWDLSVLYQDFNDPKIEEDFSMLQQLSQKAQGLMNGDPKEALENMTDAMEEISRLTSRLGSFANLTLATEATNEPAQQLMDRLMVFSVQLSLLSSAYTRYVGSLDNLEELIASSEKLKAVDFSLRQQKEAAKHLMDPAIEEWMLKMSLTGGDAFSNLRDKLDATLMVDYRGEQIPLAAARAKAYDPDPQVRKDAYEAEIASYAKIEIPMAACLNSIKGEALTTIEATHFDSILDQTLFQSNMDRETLDAMLTAIRESLPAFRKYLRKKGEILGHKDGLPFYDLFAPISPKGYTPKTYTIEEAREKLIYEMSKFSPEMGAFIAEAFDNRWIDVFPREGKGGGAFCSELHHLDQSRVLTNFAGSFSDVSTLAHELGHAWHNRCMAGLPACMIDAPMPLAETASIFNETLLANAAMAQAEKKEKFALLEGNLMETTQTIVDIYSRYLFESAVIEQRKERTLSVNELKELMLSAQEQSYGDGLSKEVRHPYMWACKCHYYFSGLSFYNFPYAFGQLFGAGVFAQYQEKGATFVPRYNQLLRSCGSGMIADVAKSVGINVRSADFWRESLKVYEKQIDSFIALADELMNE
ncbi:MAG: M3 family oligoendopeptidase [Clostridiales bacterium]|nr:M3 family oligoendopeptidase [Clostridiales bacterium]